MAQLHRHVDPPKTPAPTIATIEQLLRGEASKVSPSSSSPFFERSKQRGPEEDHGHHQKKSVLTKVKEKAKKLRQSLSKKKHDDGNVTPTLGENENEDDDTEYLGAPMYESEQAPEGYKEKARQHPRATPVIADNHVLPSSVREKPLSPSKSKRSTAHPATANHPPGPSKTMPHQKLIPTYATGSSGAAHSISPKFRGLTISKPPELQISSAPTALKTSLALTSPKTPPANITSQTFSDASVAPRASSAPVTPQTSSVSAAPLSGKSSSPSDQIWDKGVSVKEYLMNKFEPGEDERALSQVISEAMSPRKSPRDKGVMEKVKDAVTSLLGNQEPSQNAGQTPSIHTPSEIPVSTDAHEVVEEKNQGRILQAN